MFVLSNHKRTTLQTTHMYSSTMALHIHKIVTRLQLTERVHYRWLGKVISMEKMENTRNMNNEGKTGRTESTKSAESMENAVSNEKRKIGIRRVERAR